MYELLSADNGRGLYITI